MVRVRGRRQAGLVGSAVEGFDPLRVGVLDLGPATQARDSLRRATDACSEVLMTNTKPGSRAPEHDEPIPRRWLSPDEAAAYLGVTRRWLQRRREERNGPLHSRFGQAIFYDVAELDAWVEANAVAQDGGGA